MIRNTIFGGYYTLLFLPLLSVSVPSLHTLLKQHLWPRHATHNISKQRRAKSTLAMNPSTHVLVKWFCSLHQSKVLCFTSTFSAHLFLQVSAAVQAFWSDLTTVLPVIVYLLLNDDPLLNSHDCHRMCGFLHHQSVSWFPRGLQKDSMWKSRLVPKTCECHEMVTCQRRWLRVLFLSLLSLEHSIID